MADWRVHGPVDKNICVMPSFNFSLFFNQRKLLFYLRAEIETERKNSHAVFLKDNEYDILELFSSFEATAF